MTRPVPSDFAAAIGAETTTLARCWRVTRADGVRLGFTDHDRDIAFEGTVFAAATGLTAEALEQGLGLAPPTQGITGALSAAAVTEADIAAGLYDRARIEHWLCDWTDPARRLLRSVGELGEITRRGAAFDAEILGLTARLNRPQGRVYQPLCDATLGDARCGVDLAAPAYRSAGVVVAVEGAEIAVTGLEGFAPGWFTGGRVVFASGSTATIAVDRPGRLTLATPHGAEPGAAFEAEAGCDKTLATCRGKFSNILNFRGFPHLPGDDWAAGYPQEGAIHDGGSLNRG